jgi:hypothetical protein
VTGQRLVLEVKYVMNWDNACRAEHQFKWFLDRVKTEATSVAGGIVVFQRFSRDWARKKSSWLLESAGTSGTWITGWSTAIRCGFFGSMARALRVITTR